MRRFRSDVQNPVAACRVQRSQAKDPSDDVEQWPLRLPEALTRSQVDVSRVLARRVQRHGFIFVARLHNVAVAVVSQLPINLARPHSARTRRSVHLSDGCLEAGATP
jgi:hypothetical protein